MRLLPSPHYAAETECIVLRRLPTRPHLLYMASVLCHEMIHQYMMENGTELRLMLADALRERPHDPHTQPFIDFMRETTLNTGLGMQTVITMDMETYTKELVLAARALDPEYAGNPRLGLAESAPAITGVPAAGEIADWGKTLDSDKIRVYKAEGDAFYAAFF